MNWFITGGCGFIGTNLIADLVREGGHRICVLDNLSVGKRSDLAAAAAVQDLDGSGPIFGAEGVAGLIQGDILDADLVVRSSVGADLIVHLAANTGVGPSVADPRTDCLSNVVGTLNVLEAARFNGVRRFVFASSGAPLGAALPPLHEELAPRPVSPYGASKLAGEGYCSAYFRTFGIDTVALRFGNVYGPRSGHKTSVVARFIHNAMSGEPLEVFGDGGQTRDYIFIDDLVRAIRLAASAPGVGGEIFQIATSRETTVLELVEQLVPVLRASGIESVEVVHGEPRLGDVRRNVSDTRKAAARLNWSAEVGLAEGLDRTVSWFTQSAAAEGAASV